VGPADINAAARRRFFGGGHPHGRRRHCGREGGWSGRSPRRSTIALPSFHLCRGVVRRVASAPISIQTSHSVSPNL
jgi:hypothetical protein